MMKRVFYAVSVLVAQIFALVSAKLVHAQYGGYGGWGPGMMGYGLAGWFPPIMMLIFWGAVIVAIIFLVRWLVHGNKGSSTFRSEETAVEILKKRYARGEINKEEFEQKRKDLL
jgi:putative membrane protein